MPMVTATPRGTLNGEVVTEFTDTTSTSSVTYTYTVLQSGIVIENSGVSDVFVTVGNFSNQTIAPNTKWKATVPFTTISIRSDVNSQEFIATTFQNNVEGSGVADVTARSIAKKTGSYAYNADIGLKRWRSAIAKLKAGQQSIYNVCVVGDSITEGGRAGAGAGQGAPSLWHTNGYVGRIRTALSAKYGDCGSGFIPVYYPNGAPMWTFGGGGWTDNFAYGVTRWVKNTSVNGATATLSFNGTGIGIVYVRGSGTGNITYSIDGGAAVTISTFNATTITNAVTEITGLTAGDHTIVITNAEAKLFYLAGAYPIKGTAGTRVNMCGRWGTKAFDSTISNSLDIVANMFQPILTIIAIGANDYSGSTPLQTYKDQVQTIITRSMQYGDVLLLANAIRTDTGFANPLSAFSDALKELALQNNVAFIDLFNRWGGDASYANTTLGFISDNIHPNDYGHQDTATAILNALLEPGA